MINRLCTLSRLIETGIVHYTVPWQPPVITVSDPGEERDRRSNTAIWNTAMYRGICLIYENSNKLSEVAGVTHLGYGF